MRKSILIILIVALVFLTACKKQDYAQPIQPMQPMIQPEGPIQEPSQQIIQPEESIQEPTKPDTEEEQDAEDEDFEIPRITSTITPARDITGNWAGSLTFTNNCPNPSCRYIGRLNPSSVTMNLAQNGNIVAGAVTINFANFEIEELIPGLECGTFQALVQAGIQSQSVIINGVISSSEFTFTDVGGNFWELGVTTDTLQGTISNKEPGCSGIQSDEVILRRQS